MLATFKFYHTVSFCTNRVVLKLMGNVWVYEIKFIFGTLLAFFIFKSKSLFSFKQVTWADFYWDICSTTLLVLKPDLLDIHPKLASLRKKVQAIPAIAAWIQKRPQTKLWSRPQHQTRATSVCQMSHTLLTTPGLSILYSACSDPFCCFVFLSVGI